MATCVPMARSTPNRWPMGSTTSVPDEEMMMTSRPAALCSSISATASSYTSGSTISSSVSPTICCTLSAGHPVTSFDMYSRIASIWSWSAPETRYMNCAYALRTTVLRPIRPSL